MLTFGGELLRVGVTLLDNGRDGFVGAEDIGRFRRFVGASPSSLVLRPDHSGIYNACGFGVGVSEMGGFWETIVGGGICEGATTEAGSADRESTPIVGGR